MKIRRVLAVVLMTLALSFGASLAEPVLVAPGVSVEGLRDPAGPWEIRVIRVERENPAVSLMTALGEGRLRGREALTGIVDREAALAPQARVVAAINADFFRMRGPAMGGVGGACVRNGELITTPRGRPALFVDADGSPRIETTQTSATVTVGERTWPMDGMNMPDQGGEGAVQMFTEIGGWQLCDGCVVAELQGGPLQTQGQWEAIVTEVIAPGTDRQAGSGEALIAARDEPTRAALLQARAGEVVQIALETPPFDAPVLQAVGGSHVLVRGGEVVAGDQVRHPRTAAGSNDREMIFVTVDGRQPGWSVGMTLTELAELMQRLGCTDAINLDGGGSTTAWAQGSVINRPSGGVERPIANAVFVLYEDTIAH